MEYIFTALILIKIDVAGVFFCCWLEMEVELRDSFLLLGGLFEHFSYGKQPPASTSRFLFFLDGRIND